MIRVMNCVCLSLWCFALFNVISKVLDGEPVSPVYAMGALTVCILHYVDKVIFKED
jgi:hypothetical protein